jgi:hypothetical protein
MSFSQTEPWWLSFGCWLQAAPPPLAHRLIARTQDPNPGLPHPNLPPTTQIRAPLHVVRENRAPVAWFLISGPNLPHPGVPLNQVALPPQPQLTPPQAGPLYSTPSSPAIYSQKPSHGGSVSVLLLFLVNSTYFNFSTIHRCLTFYFIYTCIYIIKVSIHKIWVLFRGVISWWN